MNHILTYDEILKMDYDEFLSIRKEDKSEVEIPEGVVPHIGNFKITTRIPVDSSMSNNGGDYHEWDSYRDHGNGVFELYSNTSCDFDCCGTGYEGFYFISEEEYLRLKEKESKLEPGD